METVLVSTSTMYIYIVWDEVPLVKISQGSVTAVTHRLLLQLKAFDMLPNYNNSIV